jgi:hypothetical protein
MEKTDRNIAEFIESIPEESRDDIRSLDATISTVMEGLDRVLFVGRLWGGSDQQIIGYGTQKYRRSDKREVEWFAVGLALQKNYISIYINVVEGREYLSEKYGKDLGKVKVGKSSIGFTSLDDIDIAKLTSLVEKARTISESDG